MSIKDKIHSVRNLQVMLDEDLASLYGVTTKRLNEQVKRNIARFPTEFCFKLTKSEYKNLKSQFATSSVDRVLRSQFATFNKKVGRKYLPFVFTEQGVAMLSAVLKSDIAIKVSISVMNAFISMRKIIAESNQIFVRLDIVERKQIVTEQKIEQVLSALASQEEIPAQKLFFENKAFDASVFVSKLIRSANQTIILIDNYVNETVLELFTKRKDGAQVVIYTKKITPILKSDLEKFNTQYPPISIRELDKSHDRFLVIDNLEVYHFGASLKDLGKKWFVVTKLDVEGFELLKRLSKIEKTSA